LEEEEGEGAAAIQRAAPCDVDRGLPQGQDTQDEVADNSSGYEHCRDQPGAHWSSGVSAASPSAPRCPLLGGATVTYSITLRESATSFYFHITIITIITTTITIITTTITTITTIVDERVNVRVGPGPLARVHVHPILPITGGTSQEKDKAG
jgi:hypothetical protein